MSRNYERIRAVWEMFLLKQNLKVQARGRRENNTLLRCSVSWEQKELLKWNKISNMISHVLHQLSEAIAPGFCTVKFS